jgi:hypothetical protein
MSSNIKFKLVENQRNKLGYLIRCESDTIQSVKEKFKSLPSTIDIWPSNQEVMEDSFWWNTSNLNVEENEKLLNQLMEKKEILEWAADRIISKGPFTI